MVSLKDVAQRAGVSAMTVSRTLNGNYPVSAETRARVLSAATELEYEPNVMGRNLRSPRNRTVIVAGLGFVEPMLTGVYAAASELGYDVLLMHTRLSSRGDFVRRIRNGMASGLLFMNMMDEEAMAEVAERYPLVQCGSGSDLTGACTVTVDEEDAAHDLVVRLAMQGRRRIAYASVTIAGQPPLMTLRREKGYLRALVEHGLPSSSALRSRSEFLREDLSPALAQADRWLRMDPAERPDAIVFDQNVQAVACVNRFREAGVALPREVAVASFDDQPIDAVVQPTLTAVGRPYEEMGREAMRMLAARIEGRPLACGRMVFPHVLMARGSTGPL
jgi:DNA-binding LacI/PurR family transcriptional regulator